MKSITRLVLIIVILLVGVGIVGAQDAPASDLPQFNDRVEAVGDVLILYGQMMDSNGDPLLAPGILALAGLLAIAATTYHPALRSPAP